MTLKCKYKEEVKVVREEVIKIADKLVGKITHYYDKINVAVLKLGDILKVGDQIKIVKNDQEFTQAVTSMQVEHENIKEAKKGDEVGLKVDQPVKEGAQVYLVS